MAGNGCPVGGGGQLGGRSAIVTINDEGTIQSVDRGCCEMFGYDMHDLPGQSVKVLIPAPYKEQHDSYMAEYHRTGVAKIIGRKRTVEGLHRSGVVFPVRLAVNEVNTGRGRIYIGMLEAMPHHVADFLCDAAGVVLQCSGGVEDIWGIPVAQVRGMRLEALLPLEGRSFAEVFARYLADGSGGVVGCVRNARALLSNGTHITVCLSIRHDEEVTSGAAVALETSERDPSPSPSTPPGRFRARVERVDLDREAVFTLRPDGVVLSANSAFLLPLMGYTESELLGVNISRVLPDLEGTLLPKRLKRKSNNSRSSVAEKESDNGSQGEGTSAAVEEKRAGRGKETTAAVAQIDSKSNSGNGGGPEVGSKRPRGEEDATERKKRRQGDSEDGEQREESTVAQGREKEDERDRGKEREKGRDRGKEREKERGARRAEEEGTADTKRDERSVAEEDFDEDEEGQAKRSLWLSGSLGGSSIGLPSARTRCIHKDGSDFFVEVRLARFLSNSNERLSVMVRRAQEVHSPDNAEPDERTPIGLDFVMGPRRIGAGSFGKVRQGWRTSTNEPVAIKVVEKTLIDAAELQRARREISIMRSLDHPSICRLYDVVETKESIYIVMELCANGELFQYVTSRGRLEEAEARTLFKQIIEAVDYCHSKSIIHRDIKHKNILLDQENRIKLIDFGLSNYATKDGLRSTFCGTPAYSAPEMILAQKYSGPEVDVWSVGVVLFSMLTGEFPFKTVSHIIDGSYTMPDYISPHCQDAIRAMLVVDGKLRATAKELLAHPFVA